MKKDNLRKKLNISLPIKPSETNSKVVLVNISDISSGIIPGTTFTDGAVRLESSGTGALLFTNRETADFLSKKYKEPIFTYDDKYCIGWSDEFSSLFWFAGISFLRLLNVLSLDNTKHHWINNVIEKLLNNIRFAHTIEKEKILSRSLILALLSLPDVNTIGRNKAIEVFNVKPEEFVTYKKLIDIWLVQRKKEILLMKCLSEMDSSIPNDNQYFSH